MIIIVCLDESGGMMFNRRRQSKDRVVTDDIRRMCAGGRLWMNHYSEKLFAPAVSETSASENDGVEFMSDEAFPDRAGAGEYCFVENMAAAPYEAQIEKIIVYNWNRKYPSDRKFDIDLSQWQTETTVDMEGYSHEKITKTVYVRDKDITNR